MSLGAPAQPMIPRRPFLRAHSPRSAPISSPLSPRSRPFLSPPPQTQNLP